MKSWRPFFYVLIVTSVLVAYALQGGVGRWLGAARQSRQWDAKADQLRAALEQEGPALREKYPAFEAARSHLVGVPDGSDPKPLALALIDVDRERGRLLRQRAIAALGPPISPELLATGDYGPPPQDVTAQVASHLAGTATATAPDAEPQFDPGFRQQGWLRDASAPGGFRLGWIQTIGVSRPDARGWYRSFEDLQFFFADGKLVRPVTLEMIANEQAGFKAP